MMSEIAIRQRQAADQFRNAGGGPEIRSIAVHHRPLQKKVDQAPSMPEIQLQRRPGEERTRNALAPPFRRASRQRITELGLQPMRRPTSLRE
jgi:hypothetical protein